MKTSPALLLALVLCSCTVRQQTVAPLAPVAHQASFSGNSQTSGIIAVEADGFRVDQHFIDRYTALLATYGARFTPPLKSDDSRGILVAEKGLYVMDAEAMARFDKMRRWQRAEAGP